MADRLVYDLSSEVDSAQVSPFLSKTWISIVDDNNTNYSSGVVSISSSISANSNKWLGWREAYFQVPILITLTTNAVTGI